MQGLLYISKKGREMKKIAGCGGKTAVVFTNEQSPRRVGLLAGSCWTKSQSPCCPRGGGGMVTNDWYLLSAGRLTNRNDQKEH